MSAWDSVAESTLLAPRAQPQAPAPRQSSKAVAPANPLAIRSMVDAGTTIRGSMECRDNLMIDGTVEGNVAVTASGNMVLVRQGAVIRGNVQATTVLCAGTVVGDIQADNVRLFKTAAVRGEVHAKRIGMEPGCALDCPAVACGDVVHTSEPGQPATPTPAPVAPQRPARNPDMGATVLDPGFVRARVRA